MWRFEVDAQCLDRCDHTVNLLGGDALVGLAVAVVVVLELHIAVDQGVNITALAHSIMGEVSYKVNQATGVPVSCVDVYVDAMLIG